MTNQTKNNNLSYLIDPTFAKSIDCLSYRLKTKKQITFSKYYVPNVQIKDFNVLIDEKSYFDMPIKNEKETQNKLLKWEETMITRQAIYWIMNTFQNITY